MAESTIIAKPDCHITDRANTDHSWSSLFSTSSQIVEERVGGILIVNFFLRPESNISADMTSSHSITNLNNKAVAKSHVTLPCPLGGATIGNANCVQIIVNGQQLQYYAPYGWKTDWQMRGQIVAPLA